MPLFCRVFACVFGFFAPFVARAQTRVVTYQYENNRSGVNRNEVLLNPANVSSLSFGKLFAHSVDGLVYAQPLYLPNVTVSGRGSHNVLYVVTEHDSVYAFDADNNTGPNASPLWQVSFLGPGVTTMPAVDTGCDQIEPEIGITGTPVIDTATETMYLVATTKETAAGSSQYVHRLHALDVRSGAERPGSPVAIQATYPGRGGTTVTFSAKNHKQRPGLLMLNGIVYVAFSSHCDIGAYHGWLMGYDAATLKQVAVYNTTPEGNGASFWAGGAAPAADSDGNIFVISANGTFDAAADGRDIGESFIKLSSASGLSVLDYFTPFNYAPLNDADVDTGSAGVVLLGDEAGSAAHPHLMASAGKEGRIYLLDRDRLGGWHADDDSQIVQSLPDALGGLFGNPAYFNSTLYFCGSGNPLQAYLVHDARMSGGPSSESPEAYGYPGCVPSISSNGTQNGVVWSLQVQPSGALAAYDAGNLKNELYSSEQNAARDHVGEAVKFSVPMIANGKVYAGTSSELVVYGLVPQEGSTLATANAASGTANFSAPGAIASIYGSGLAAGSATANSFPLPHILAGASVTVNGVGAPVYFASPSQINFQIPFEAVPGAASIVVSVNGALAGSVKVPLFSSAPGIFLEPDSSAAAVNEDGSVNSADHPASAGSFVSVFMTGAGPLSSPVASGVAAPAVPLATVAGVTARIGGASAMVTFAGLAPGFAGLYQINLEIPALPAGTYDIEIFVNGSGSNTAPIHVR
jgi:uncharacterized protein (TIGR03437 family)